MIEYPESITSAGPQTGPPAGAGLRVHLLGKFEVRLGDRLLLDSSWPRRKAKAILKLLALRKDRSLHRDQLIELLWPDTPLEGGANSFRQSLHHLRRAIAADGAGPAAVTVGRDIVALSRDAWTDVDAFRWAAEAALGGGDATMYERALGLYAGELLPEDRYEDWTEIPREELRSLHARLLYNFAALQERQGKVDDAVDLVRGLIRQDPADEEAHRALMRLYAGAGQRARALRQYERFREFLRRELGAEPAEESRVLYDQIRDGLVGPSPPVDPSAPHHQARTLLPLSEPLIRYAKTADGVKIAFWVLGDGPPIVHMPRIPFSHIQGECQIPRWFHWYQCLAARRMLVRYDSRGSGLSELNIDHYSLDAMELDLDAVVNCLGLRRFALLGFGHSAPVAIAYAARYPARLSHLILWCPYARGTDFWGSPRTQAFRALRATDWLTYTETAAYALFGWCEGGAARQLADLMRESLSQEVAEVAFEAIRQFDVIACLSQVRTPTLVLHRAGIPQPETSQCRRLASEMPGARAAILEGDSALPFIGDSAAVVRVIDEFLGGSG